jgi:hypothetical protein
VLTPEEIDQLASLVRGVIREELALAKRSPDKTAAERMRRYRARNRNVTSRSKRNASEGKAVTLRNVELPEWMPMPQWEAYVEMRKKSKKPLTVMATNMAISKLEELKGQGHHPARVLAQSVFHSWQGLFEVKDK